MEGEMPEEMTPPEVSIVIPVYNEAESLQPLYQGLVSVLDALGRPYELLFIDDGSTDGSFDLLAELHAQDPRLQVIQFRRNFGKAAALTAGFAEARGAVIVTMDADLQDDPQEMPALLNKLAEGFDLVSGWKHPRRDPPTKTLPSKLFNWATSRLSGIWLHDFNCGFKAYRREVVQEIRFYGDLYRYIPVLAHWRGFRVTEVAVRHHPRRFGRSKFGASRFLRGFFDLITILFLTQYIRRPLHLFGWVGLLSLGVGTVINLYLTVLWFLGDRPIGDRPLLTLGVLLMIMGVQFVSFGLLAEMLASVSGRGVEDYSIRTRLK
jgi:glycosyltransferase involved in cell wall biosynthesis